MPVFLFLGLPIYIRMCYNMTDYHGRCFREEKTEYCTKRQAPFLFKGSARDCGSYSDNAAAGCCAFISWSAHHLTLFVFLFKDKLFNIYG